MDRFIRPQAMTKTRSQQLSEKADEQRRRCRQWLLPLMRDNQSKFLTKAELRDCPARTKSVKELL